MIARLLPSGSFSRNVITLMTGTSIAQVIPIAISPILTRLYTPDDLGVFALYMALTSIFSVVVTGRYEQAIMLPKKNIDAAHIVALIIAVSCIISSILLLIVIAFSPQLANLLGVPKISKWLYLVPVSALLAGVYQSLIYWENRRKKYERIVVSRMLQSSSISVAQLGAGYVSLDSVGLVGGQIIGQGFSTMLLARMMLRDNQNESREIKKNKILALARRYVNFPKYLVVAHGFNTASSQAPVIMLGSLFNSSAMAGFYMLTQRVIGAPSGIIAAAIGDVFRQEASYAYVHNGNCKAIYIKALKRLSGIAFVPFVIFYFVAPDLFGFVFGEKWRVSGEYAQLLTPMFFLRFITSPLSSMFVIAQKQRMDLIWQSVLFGLVLASFCAGYFQESIRVALILFSISYCIMYLVNGIITFRLSCGRLNDFE